MKEVQGIFLIFFLNSFINNNTAMTKSFASLQKNNWQKKDGQ